MFDQFIKNFNTPNIPIQFSSQPNWYLLFWFHFSNILVFIFGIGHHSISSVYENIQFWYPTSDFKTRVRSKHQKTIRWTQLVWNSKWGKPTSISSLFLVTLVISSTVPNQYRECYCRELVVLRGWDFDIVVGIVFSNSLHEQVRIIERKCMIYWMVYHKI